MAEREKLETRYHDLLKLLKSEIKKQQPDDNSAYVSYDNKGALLYFNTNNQWTSREDQGAFDIGSDLDHVLEVYGKNINPLNQSSERYQMDSSTYLEQYGVALLELLITDIEKTIERLKS